jgi:hypothetical protein
MRLPLLLILFFIFVSCYGQNKKDLRITAKSDSSAVQKSYVERKDTTLLRLNEFLIRNHIGFIISDMPYFNTIPKLSLSGEYAKMVETPKQLAEKNLNTVMEEVKEETSDKRGWFAKLLEDILPFAEKIAAVALAIAVLLK